MLKYGSIENRPDNVIGESEVQKWKGGNNRWELCYLSHEEIFIFSQYSEVTSFDRLPKEILYLIFEFRNYRIFREVGDSEVVEWLE